MQRRRIDIACVVIAWAVAVSAASGRPSHYGLALPYPQSTPNLVTESPAPYFVRERLVAAVLRIDPVGAVLETAAEDPRDSAFVRYVDPWLKSIRFAPATFNGEAAACRLPVILQFVPRVTSPDLYFPVDSTAAVIDADLYWKALALNDIQLPRLEQFPSYFCDLKSSDTSATYGYVLAQAGLDTTGRVTNVEEVASTLPAFTQQILSAILWAKFSPAVVRSTPVPAQCFVLISFFPQVNYPTRVWERAQADSLSLQDRFRVRLLPDTVDLLAKPIAAKLRGEQFTVPGPHAPFRETVTAMLTVDTSGRASVVRLSGGSKEVQAAARELFRQLRFYPAFDYDGRPRRFSGLATLMFVTSPTVRIRYNWLPPVK